ncbi:MAG TPA: hypothetical protein VFU23_05160 [Gemmatimonadales bacterium]|nr:hypothetical protein [Gemmatimonadales bacterium]
MSSDAHPAGGAADPLGVVASALGFGAAVGVGLQALVSFGVDALKSGLPADARPSLTSPHALVLLLGTPAGIALAGFAAWYFLGPVANPWRRSMLSIVGGLGSFVLSVLLIWPVFSYFGRPGLIGLMAGTGLVSVIMARRMGRTAP